MNRLFAAVLLCACLMCAQQTNSERRAWNKPFPPFRIAGDIYYVGASGVSSFLITTPQGHILLDGGLPETAPLIERNIAALGFRMRDVKYLLNNHAHYDHCGGLAELKHASHAQLVASRADAPTLISGHQLSYGPGQSDTHFPAVAVDRLIDDGDTVSLGGVILTAHLTPGHTKGSTTWTTSIVEGGKTYQVVFASSMTVAGNRLIHNRKYPGIVADYEKSFAQLRALPCDIFLTAHPGFFDLQEKFARMRKDGPNPFVNAGELHRFVDESERNFNRELKKQKEAVRIAPKIH